MTSSFLDSMIPREHISDMNQFDFVCDIVEKKDRYTLSGELPGCNVKNVDIKMDKDNNLHVSAHKSTKHEEEDQSRDGRMKWHAIERIKRNTFRTTEKKIDEKSVFCRTHIAFRRCDHHP